MAAACPDERYRLPRPQARQGKARAAARPVEHCPLRPLPPNSPSSITVRPLRQGVGDREGRTRRDGGVRMRGGTSVRTLGLHDQKERPMASEDADTTRTDQLTFQNPGTRYPEITPPEQEQEEPGLQAEMTPMPDSGEFSYHGTGRRKGRSARITGGDSGFVAAFAVAFGRESADGASNYLPDEEEEAALVARIS